MTTPVMNLCNLIEDVKSNLTDAQYMAMLEELRTIHTDYTWNNRPDVRLVTPIKVIALAHNIVRCGVQNPGQLAYILNKKGFWYQQYLYESFKEWMHDIGILIINNRLQIR
jgi:hypothetical protein